MAPIIAQVLSLGYTAAQVLHFLSGKMKNVAPSIKNAKSQGFSDDEILKFLSGKIKSKGFQEQLSENNSYLKQQGLKTKGERQETRNKYLQGALNLGAGALGSYALSRALPKSPSALTGQLLPALPQQQQLPGAHQPLGLPAPGQAPIQPPYNPSPQGQGPLPYTNPTAQGARAPSPTQSPIPQAPAPVQNTPTPPIPSKTAPLPPALIKQAESLLKAGNDTPTIAGTLKKLNPQVVKDYEKAANAPIETAVEEFAKQNISVPQGQNTSNVGGEVQQKRPENEIPMEQPLEPAPEQIKPPEEKKEVRKTVALPNGDIGEITNIRQGIATVNSQGKEYRRKLDELIESPIPEKDMVDLFKELTSSIEAKSGEEISRMVNWAGYDPKTNELAFVPHLGALYVYDDISPEDAKELTNILSSRKTTGENFIGAWKQGSKSPIGAAMSRLIQKLQKERGGKGSEYKGKYEKIYDAFELPKIEAKAKHAKEKEDDKKRKAKKPRPS